METLSERGVRPGESRQSCGQSGESGRTIFKLGAERAKLPVCRGFAASIFGTEGTNMPAEVLVRVSLNQLRGSEDLGTARDMAEANRVAQLGTRGVVSGLVSGAVAGEDGDRERCRELLEALIGEVRRGKEIRGRIGGIFVEAAARTIEALVVRDCLDPPASHRLATANARAGAEAPRALAQRLIGQIGGQTDAGPLPFDPDTEIERLRLVLEADEYFLHRNLDERVGPLPEEARAAFAHPLAAKACKRPSDSIAAKGRPLLGHRMKYLRSRFCGGVSLGHPFWCKSLDSLVEVLNGKTALGPVHRSSECLKSMWEIQMGLGQGQVR